MRQTAVKAAAVVASAARIAAAALAKAKAAGQTDPSAVDEAAIIAAAILEGILPICSFCKRIRTVDGRWEQLESYISAHSEAQFSHDLCQECLAKHYPEFSARSVVGAPGLVPHVLDPEVLGRRQWHTFRHRGTAFRENLAHHLVDVLADCSPESI